MGFTPYLFSHRSVFNRNFPGSTLSSSLDFAPYHYSFPAGIFRRTAPLFCSFTGELEHHCHIIAGCLDLRIFMGNVELLQSGKMDIFCALCPQVQSIRNASSRVCRISSLRSGMHGDWKHCLETVKQRCRRVQ